MENGVKFVRAIGFVFLLLLFIAPRTYSEATDINPVVISATNINSDLNKAKQIVRSSTGRIYYFIGNAGTAGSTNGWVEVYSSDNGEIWSLISTQNHWASETGISVAIDSQDVIHVITYDWNRRPYYQKFNTPDSPKGDLSWEGYELLENQKNLSFELSARTGQVTIAIDANDVPHMIYSLHENYKGKLYTTIYYTNKVGGVWNKVSIVTKEYKLLYLDTSIPLDIAIGPDNIPHILAINQLMKGNANNPSYFLKSNYFGIGDKATSFVIHNNGDIRVAVVRSDKSYCNYFYDHTQAWNSLPSIDSSGIKGINPLLVLSDDIPYTIDLTYDNRVTVQREFYSPVNVASPLTEYGPFSSITIKWSFYNNHSPENTIDIGMQSYQPAGNNAGNYYWYASYLFKIKAAFSAVPTTGLKPLAVNFTDNSITTGGRTIVSWEWDFKNDGIIDSILQNPTAVYSDAELYTVKLTVTDSIGNQDTIIKNNYIEVLYDTDEDGIPDTQDNCSFVYNQTQIDLDADGIGDACDDYIDLLKQTVFTTGLRKETTNESNRADVTAIMKDGLFTDIRRIQKSRSGYDVLSFSSNMEAKNSHL